MGSKPFVRVRDLNKLGENKRTRTRFKNVQSELVSAGVRPKSTLTFLDVIDIMSRGTNAKAVKSATKKANLPIKNKTTNSQNLRVRKTGQVRNF